jgi:hypothetical protein
VVGLRALEVLLGRPQRLFFALERMINARPKAAEAHNDSAFGLDDNLHTLLRGDDHENVGSAVVGRQMSGLSSNGKTPRTSVKIVRGAATFSRVPHHPDCCVFSLGCMLTAAEAMRRDTSQHGPDFSQGVVFVFTDLEGSTPMAEFDPMTFDYLLQVHDSIIRETLATEGGYEMNTQGDEFQLAFPSIWPAVRFCMSLQVYANAASTHRLMPHSTVSVRDGGAVQNYCR